MPYTEQYYYYYKYPQYQVAVGVPVGIGLCVLVVCLSVFCQQRKKQQQQQALEEEETAKRQEESAKYHALNDVAGDKTGALGELGENSGSGGGRGGAASPLQQGGGVRQGGAGARPVPPAPPGHDGGEGTEVHGLSRFEQIGGDWVGFASRGAGSTPVPDGLYFQMRGLMAVGAHRDRIGSYTVDGVMNTRNKALSFSKTYATSRATMEYEFDLWDEPGSEFSLTVMTGNWAGRGAHGTCVLFSKLRHARLIELLERVRQDSPAKLSSLADCLPGILECKTLDEVLQLLD